MGSDTLGLPKALHDAQEVLRLDERERPGTVVLGGQILRDLPPQRQGNTLANKPQSARPVKKDDISLALYVSGTCSRFFFASALMSCNEALLTGLQSHLCKFCWRMRAATNFLLRKSIQ